MENERFDELTAGDLVPEAWDVMHISTSPCGTSQTWAVNRTTHVELVEIVDTTALVAANNRAAIDFSRTSSHGDAVHVAPVPNAIGAKWDREGWSEQDRARWLNDPDNRAFRTTSNWRV